MAWTRGGKSNAELFFFCGLKKTLGSNFKNVQGYSAQSIAVTQQMTLFVQQTYISGG